MNARITLGFVLTASLLTACSGDAPSSTPPPGSQPAAMEPKAEPLPPMKTAPPLQPGAEKTPLPPSHPPIDKAAMAGLVFVAPAGWVKEEPSVAMRREQYRLPKQGADAVDATVTVSVMAPDDGGKVEANLQRWAGMFAQPDGSKSRDALKQSTRKLGSANVIEIDLSGTYVVDETIMGGANKYNEPGWRMLISWIQSPTGNYYVKVVGPAATVGHWEPSFRQFVSSAAP